MSDATPVGRRHRSVLLPLSSERARRQFRSPFRSPDVAESNCHLSSPLLRQKRVRIAATDSTLASQSNTLGSDTSTVLSPPPSTNAQTQQSESVSVARGQSDSAVVLNNVSTDVDHGDDGRLSPVIANATCTARSTPIRRFRGESLHRPAIYTPTNSAAPTLATPNTVDSHDNGAAGDATSSAAAVAMETLDSEISRLEAEGCSVDQLSLYTDALHRYNRVKDAAQIVMGRLAELDGVTVRSVHERFGALPASELE